jgi:apolipoprotein N-acyltransferase
VLPGVAAPTPRRREPPVLRRLRLTRTSGTRIVVALAAGLLAGLCHSPFPLGPLIVVPLAVLQWAWRGARPVHASLCGFAFGLGCYGVVVAWLRYFGIVPYVGAVAIMATSLALVGAVVAWLAARHVASPLITAAAWVVAEALLGRFPFGGFPWADVGVALHDVTIARALAAVGGVALVSFVTVAAAGFLIDGAIALRVRRRRPAALAGAGLATVLLFAVVAQAARFEPTPTGELRLAVLQGDDQQLSLAGQRVQRLTDDHLRLASRLDGPYDLIVFPESALDTDPELDPRLRAELVDLAAEHDAALLVNARVPVDRGRSDGRFFNANLLYEPDGVLQDEYAKQHLVPFGEYVPLRSVFGSYDALRTNVPYDYLPGHETVVFDVKGTPVGSVICFESAFGPLVRDSVRSGAEVIVVSTNNRSYRRSGNSAQHLALGQLRAAETGRPVVQASVSGISAVIDADGAARDRTELFEQAIVDTTVTTTTGDTLYVRFGEWVAWGCVLTLLIATVVAPRRRTS